MTKLFHVGWIGLEKVHTFKTFDFEMRFYEAH
jgi:hypothetical protein